MEFRDNTLTSGDLLVVKGVSEYVLALAYIRMNEEGTLPVVFYQGIPSVKSFLETYTHPDFTTLAAFRQDPEKPLGNAEFCGLSWVGKRQVLDGYTKAETGIVFFRRGRSAPSSNVTLGKMMLRCFFEYSDIDSLYGTTPEPNKLALRYAQKLGFTMHGPIPDFATWHGSPVPAWISHMNKADFFAREGVSS